MSQKTVRKKPRKSHRYRFHLLHRWLIKNYLPCRVADIGGGKGLFAYLLNKSGYDAVVIDPFEQALPRTFRDLDKVRTTLTPKERTSMQRINKPFKVAMAKDFDLLIGLHAHGSNIKIINACKKYDKDFILLPCCVVDEPIQIQAGIDWLDSLEEYAKNLGFDVKRTELYFKGQNIIIYANRNLKLYE